MFTIDSDNNITAARPALVVGPDPSFSTQAELAKLTAEWPVSRLVEAFNGFAGVVPFDDLKPVKKFENRQIAVTRIWGAIQRLNGNGAQPAADVASAKVELARKATPAKKAPAAKKTTESRTNKKAMVIALMRRSKGATLAEIVEATDWQKHSIRGLISTLGSKGGEKIESFKSDKGERTYRIAR